MRVGPLDFDALAHAHFQLTRSLLSERDGDDIAYFGTALAQHRKNPIDQLGGLPRPRGRLDDDGFVDRLANDPARLLIRMLHDAVHGRLRRASRSASLSCGFRDTRRATSRPPTATKSQRSPASGPRHAGRNPHSTARPM